MARNRYTNETWNFIRAMEYLSRGWWALRPWLLFTFTTSMILCQSKNLTEVIVKRVIFYILENIFLTAIYLLADCYTILIWHRWELSNLWKITFNVSGRNTTNMHIHMCWPASDSIFILFSTETTMQRKEHKCTRW